MAGGFGAFGKIPAVGDFFRLNPPPGFVSVWDDWVQHSMVASQAALAEQWDDHYMSAPIWRFSLAPALAGASQVIGVFMPSVDRVGRRFPLTLMAPLAASGTIASDHFRADGLFERLEALALDALEDDMSRDKLEHRLAGIPPPVPGRAPMVHRTGDGFVMTGENLVADLAADRIGNTGARPSIWSAMVDDVQRLMLCDGLPGDDAAMALWHMDAPVWHSGQAT
ncbi:type VI secretion system-associated protein TagF [Microbulbifer sp. S227A]|uniref:type VI secretion system-associated protein TagF n=1 Tax=Microbulbifer sp. S227A TaxID=3415131 RepID=UPI003C79BF7D